MQGRKPELSQVFWVLLEDMPLTLFFLVSKGFNEIFGYFYFLRESLADSERESLSWVKNRRISLCSLQSPETPSPKTDLHQDREYLLSAGNMTIKHH